MNRWYNSLFRWLNQNAVQSEDRCFWPLKYIFLFCFKWSHMQCWTLNMNTVENKKRDRVPMDFKWFWTSAHPNRISQNMLVSVLCVFMLHEWVFCPTCTHSKLYVRLNWKWVRDGVFACKTNWVFFAIWNMRCAHKHKSGQK